MKIKLSLDSGPSSRKNLSFSGKDVIRLGRHPDNDCTFQEEADRVVSSFHAEIRVVSGRVLIMDLDSTNGTLVNGQWAEETPLSTGDIVELGKNGPSLRVEFSSEASDPPPKPMEEMEQWATQPMPSRTSPQVADVRPPRTVPATERIQFRSYPVSRAASPHPRYSTADPPLDEASKKYGDKTVGMMIKNALAQAGLAKKSGTSKSTDYLEAMMDDRVRKTSFRLKRIIVGALILLLVAGGTLAFVIYQNRTVSIYQTTQYNMGEAAGGSIAASNRYSIFMLAGQQTKSNGQPDEMVGFCTAFAVAQSILATNAHCVKLAETKFRNVLALMNGAPTNRYPVVRTLAHPGYVPGRLSPDVGLIRIKGEIYRLAAIAPADVLAAISPGLTMFLYGFPGRLNRVDAPEATFAKGDIGRVTTFEQRLGEHGANTLLQHSAHSATGTSGSPIFNTNGQVIGINAGGYLEDGQPMSGYNFAMRIDLIDTLLPSLATN